MLNKNILKYIFPIPGPFIAGREQSRTMETRLTVPHHTLVSHYNKTVPKEFERTPADKTMPAPTEPQVRGRSRKRRVPSKIGFDAGRKPD